MLTPLTFLLILSLLCLGMFAGFLGGLLGIGGGILIVPALIMLFGLEPHKAIAISAAVIVPTALVAMLKHSAAGLVDYRFVLFIALAAIVGSYLGALANHSLSGDSLKKIFAVAMILIGLNLLLSKSTATASLSAVNQVENKE